MIALGVVLVLVGLVVITPVWVAVEGRRARLTSWGSWMLGSGVSLMVLGVLLTARGL